MILIKKISKYYLEYIGFKPFKYEDRWKAMLELEACGSHIKFIHRLHYDPYNGECYLSYVYFDRCDRVIRRNQIKKFNFPLYENDMNCIIENCKIFINRINNIPYERIRCI